MYYIMCLCSLYGGGLCIMNILVHSDTVNTSALVYVGPTPPYVCLTVSLAVSACLAHSFYVFNLSFALKV